MVENKKEINAPSMSFTTFLLKLLAGGAGGIVGSLVLLLIFILASSILNPLTDQALTDRVSPLFVFLIMIMVFLASTGGNVLSTLLTALTEREKYTRISTAIYQVFIVSIIIFILMVPIYFITSAIDASVMAYAVGLHLILSAQVSSLILEVISNYKYALVGIYGTAFAVLVSAAIIFGLTNVIESPAILLFIALPIIWGSISLVHSIVIMVYGWLARIYDKDFLSTQTVYGNDYGKEVIPESERTPKAKDEAGADFLRHN